MIQSLQRMLTRNSDSGRRRPYYFIAAVGMVFCLTVAVAIGWLIWDQRVAAIGTESDNLQNLSRAVADQVDRVLTSVERADDNLLQRLESGAGGPANGERFHQTMRDLISVMPEAYRFTLFDADGNLVNTSAQWPPPKLNVADRAYYQFARANPNVRSFVSEVVRSRQTGMTNFNVIRLLTGPDGAFAGMIAGAIEARYLERLFDGVLLPDGGSVALYQRDGDMLVRHPAIAPEAMQAYAVYFRSGFTTADHGTSRRRSPVDSVDQLVAYSKLPNHPLVVSVSKRFDAAIIAWWVQAAWFASIAGLGCVATAVTVVLAIRRVHDQQRLEAAAATWRLDDERRRADRELAGQHAKFGLALDNMNQGLLMFDQANRLTLANRPVQELFNLEPDRLVHGTDIAAVVAAVGEAGSLSAPVEAVTAFYLQLAEERVPRRFIRSLLDGRHITANFMPLDQGWLISFEDMTEIRKADERLAHMALHDALTGLPNRVMLRSRTEEALTGVEQSRSFAVMCIDLDHFKNVNDTMGHPTGDKLLCLVAERIKAATCRSDVVARLGGDEFAIVFSPIEDVVAIESLAKRLVQVVSAPYEVDGQRVVIGASVGISVAPDDGTDPDTLMKNADLALYRAKNDGRGRHAFFTPCMLHQAIERRRIETELLNALENREFEVYYQPLVNVASRGICGFEALLRWNHPLRGVVSPLDFIRVAEDNGSIVAIGEWVLNQACRDATQWPRDLKIAVNLSPAQFRSGKLVDMVTAALKASGLAPGRLELEITEAR